MNARRKAAFSILFFLFGTTRLVAQEFWTEPFEKWSRNQVISMISDSPWSQNTTLATALGGKDSGLQGEKEILNRFTVRFFSALPVREAYVRMMQIANKYDAMTDEQRREFDSRFKRALNLDVTDRVIVALEFGSNDTDANREIKLFLETARTDTIRQDVYLISQRLGRVELREYFPPSTDGTGAKFVFPRSVNGKEIIDAADKEVRFEFSVPLIDRNSGGARNRQRLLINFKISKMFYRGQLSY